MSEHRLVERMIELMRWEHKRMNECNKMNVIFVDTVINFIKTYADKCHNAKEEYILFMGFRKRNVLAEHKSIMDGLMAEHAYAKNITNNLVVAQKRYLYGNKSYLPDIAGFLKSLIDFYPKHIEKEEKHFSVASMDYMDKEGRDVSLNKFFGFDKDLVDLVHQEPTAIGLWNGIQDKYRKIVEQWESCYRYC